jgi:hypothetical protein
MFYRLCVKALETADERSPARACRPGYASARFKFSIASSTSAVFL